MFSVGDGASEAADPVGQKQREGDAFGVLHHDEDGVATGLGKANIGDDRGSTQFVSLLGERASQLRDEV